MTPRPETAEDRAKRAAVINGELQYLSVSALKKYMSCKRAWFFRYVLRMPDPQGKGAAWGEGAHKRTAHYLSTGEDVLTEVEKSAKHLWPTPGKDLLIEQALTGDFSLTSNGVPFKGSIDLITARGDRASPVRITDHKFKGDIVKYSTTPAQLADPTDEDGLQMIGYGAAVARAIRSGRWPGTTHIVLEHVHCQREPVADRKTKLRVYPVAAIYTEPLPLTVIESAWLTISPIVAEVIQTAKAKNPDDVPHAASRDICYKYGKCAFRDSCSYFKQPAQGAADKLRLLFKGRGTDVAEEKHMGMLDRMKTAPTVAKPIQNESVAPPAPAPAPAAPAAPAAPPVRRLTIQDVADVLPPDAPTPAARRAAETVEAKDETPPAAKAVSAPPKVTAEELLSAHADLVASRKAARKPRAPKAPKVSPEELLAMQADLKASMEPIAAPAQVEPIHKESVKAELAAEGLERRARVAANRITIYIGCKPSKTPTTPLSAYAAKTEAEILTKFKTLGVDVDDLRLSNGSDVGFGKWKAVLAQVVRELPPEGGAYTVMGLGMDERIDTIVSALEGIAEVVS